MHLSNELGHYLLNSTICNASFSLEKLSNCEVNTSCELASFKIFCPVCNEIVTPLQSTVNCNPAGVPLRFYSNFVNMDQRKNALTNAIGKYVHYNIISFLFFTQNSS